MRCKLHKKYKGKLKPKVNCPGCWYVYIDSHETYVLSKYILPELIPA